MTDELEDEPERLECAGCWSEAVVEADCFPECLAGYDHMHLRCLDCGYRWTEADE